MDTTNGSVCDKVKLQDLTEAKNASTMLRLTGTLVAGRNNQHHEPIEIVISDIGEEEDFGFTKTKPCKLVDFEGGIIASQYIRAPAKAEFGENNGWYVVPVTYSNESNDWMVLQFPPGHKNHSLFS